MYVLIKIQNGFLVSFYLSKYVFPSQNIESSHKEKLIEEKVEEITSQKQQLAESQLRQEQQAAEISEMML